MSLFHPASLAFQPVDPMADGLGDDIDAERSEADAFVLQDQLDGRIVDEWEEILSDARKDPTFTFVSDDED